MLLIFFNYFCRIKKRNVTFKKKKNATTFFIDSIISLVQVGVVAYALC